MNSYMVFLRDSISRWESVGLLRGICSEEKERVSKAFDLLAEYILNVENKISENSLPILLATLRRVLEGYPQCVFNNPSDFIEYVVSYVAYYMPYYEAKKKRGFNIDTEAECCCGCAEQIIAILKAREEDNG